MEVLQDLDREKTFNRIEKKVQKLGFRIDKQDRTRPWGGFFVIDESQAPLFIETYFPHLSVAAFTQYKKLSPKILLVAPHKRLSWQYHFRRAEIWKLVGGQAGVVISDTDEQKEVQKLKLGSIVNLHQGERHRLVGLEKWGVIAEIWQHTDPANPSDEDDIVRVQDDFGR